MRKLLILGAGQYGMVAKEIAEAVGTYDTIDFLDDNNPIAIGKLNEYENFKDSYAAVVAVGNNAFRLELLKKLDGCGFEIATLVHPKAYVSPSATIDKGSFIEPMAVIHTDAEIGIGCIISAGTVVNHNSKVEAGCHLNCGTIVASSTTVNSKTKSDYGQILT